MNGFHSPPSTSSSLPAAGLATVRDSELSNSVAPGYSSKGVPPASVSFDGMSALLRAGEIVDRRT
jgi:hypothetical protein